VLASRLKKLTVHVAGTDLAASPWEEHRLLTSRFGTLVLDVAAVRPRSYAPLLLDLQENSVVLLYTLVPRGMKETTQ
jgi:hypothetical protein